MRSLQLGVLLVYSEYSSMNINYINPHSPHNCSQYAGNPKQNASISYIGYRGSLYGS